MALKNKTDALKRLAQCIQPAVFLPANPTALSRPGQPTESTQGTGHPTRNAGSFKIVLPETTPGQILAGRGTPGGLP